MSDSLFLMSLGDGKTDHAMATALSLYLAGEKVMNIIVKVVTLLACALSVAAGRSSSCTADVAPTYELKRRTSTKSRGYDAACARRRKTPPPLAVALPPVVKNLTRGSMLKCLADLTGGLVSNT